MVTFASSRTRPDVLPWIGIAAGCAAAFFGSLWALVASSDCDACQRASEAAGRVNLALLGVLYYGHLLLLLPLRRARPYLFCAVLFAAGVHLVLIAILVHRHLVCPACFLTAAGAFFMAGVAVASDPANRRRALVALPVALLLTALARPLFRPAAAAEVAHRRQVERALSREAAEPPVAPGRTRLLIFSRPTCSLCQELQLKLLPPIRQELGAALDIQYRPAWKGLRTPTVILRGKRRAHLVGLPTPEALREAIQIAGRAGPAE